MKTISLSVLLALCLCSCRGVPLTRETRMSLDSVVVLPVEPTAPHVSYSGPSFPGYDPFPELLYSVPIVRWLVPLWALTPVGFWQTHKAYERMEEVLNERYQNEGIDVAKIVHRRLLRELHRCRVFRDVRTTNEAPLVASPREAHLDLNIEVGLSRANAGFGVGIKPWIEVEGRLKDPSGEILWHGWSSCGTSEGSIEGQDGEDYFRRPEIFRKSIERASRIAIARLVREMKNSG